MLYRMDLDYDIQGAFGTPQSGCLQSGLGWHLPRVFRVTVGAFHRVPIIEGMKKTHRNMLRLCQSSIVKQESDFIQISFLNNHINSKK